MSKKGSVKTGILVILAVFLLIIISAFFYIGTLKNPVNPSDTSKIEIQIDEGSSGIKIAEILKENELIKNAKYFLYYAKKNNLGNFKSGVYEFSKSQNLDEILKSLNIGGRPAGEKVTIPEGYDINQIVSVLESKDLINKEKFLSLTSNKDNFSDSFPFLKDDSIKTLEGFMYPETYFIKKGTDEKEIISMFLEHTQEVFGQNNVFSNPSNINPNITNLNELITLASIVEKESASESERNKVAGVFVNRLGIQMPLQSCVTVEYILQKHKQRLSYEDTQVQSPFNTYINKGLPPSPICTPTISAINAVRNYEKHDYLFFVAKQDGNHIYSKTYDEHLKATKDIYGEY